MMNMMKTLTVLALVGLVSGFTVLPTSRVVSQTASSTTLYIGGPLQKLLNKDDYETKIQNLMNAKGYTRAQAEKEYDTYLDNPDNYALQKGEWYCCTLLC